MKRYSADAVMAGLKDFQRRTVDHVVDRFYGDDPTRRFLVADETGLGKSVVARGVIAKTLELLQDDDTVDRIDVIYVCSNQDIAAQNLERLKVTTGESITLSSRLTMMARHSARLKSATAIEGKPVNLVAFTPGTSFDRGWRTGKAEERALLFLLLEAMHTWDGWSRKGALRALQGTTRTVERFAQDVDRLDYSMDGKIDRVIAREFRRTITAGGQLKRFRRLVDDIGHRQSLTEELRARSTNLIGEMRAALARSGVQTLEPDLVILDEFQRFRHLLSIEEGGESAELAQELFNYGNAKVLLLSATPYKPFTLAEESAVGDDHWANLRLTLRFLCNDPTWLAQVEEGFRTFREALIRGTSSDGPRAELQDLLLQIMSRTERPTVGQVGMLQERQLLSNAVTVSDVRGYTVMRRVADAVRAPANLEYWKSAPYFLNFTEGYKLGTELRAALKSNRRVEITDLLATGQLLDADKIDRFEPIDLGNARLRHLAADTVGRGWWRLLWMPPSMPHYELGEPFAEAATAGTTKRLIFSSWNATPTAVAGLISYEAERQISGRRTRAGVAERRRIAARLDYRLEGSRPGGMSTLSLFWPHPGLAAICDPLSAAREQVSVIRSLASVEVGLRDRIVADAPDDLRSPHHTGDVHPWVSFFRWPGAALPSNVAADMATEALGGARDEAEDSGSRLFRHVNAAIDVAFEDSYPASADPEDVADDLVALGAHSPGNIAWRAVGRLREDDWTVTDQGLWRAAATIASGLRSLFNRPESIMLLDQLELDSVYWRAVLKYCAAGGLQAVLDEYIHHLRSAISDLPLDDDALLKLAGEIGDALALRPSVYRAFNPHHPDDSIPLLSRFALRYGGRRDDVEAARQPEVRNAFNSPFWPFVLATTSAGQEGIDFHWWCSALVHWNTPANPVDFEQREGRIHRFGGHAIRRNVAARHRTAALSASGNDLWRAAYDAARAESGELGDFAPYWVYPGDAKIERHLMPYPLSRDIAKLQQLKNNLVMYRLAFGQPRQEDLLALSAPPGVDESDGHREVLDLRPPVT
jgi:hypothetical protein